MYPIGNSNHLAKQPASTGHCTAVNAPSVGLAEKWQPEIPALISEQDQALQQLVELVDALVMRLQPVMGPDVSAQVGSVAVGGSRPVQCTEIGTYLRSNTDHISGVIYRLEDVLARIHL